MASASSLSSPVGSEMGTPSSSMGVQDYRRLFIKEGLKMKVQQKIGTKKEVEIMHAISVQVPILSHVILTYRHTKCPITLILNFINHPTL